LWLREQMGTSPVEPGAGTAVLLAHDLQGMKASLHPFTLQLRALRHG
jgi:hypothetical protein